MTKKNWLAVDEDNEEVIFSKKPFRAKDSFFGGSGLGTFDTKSSFRKLAAGTIKRVTGISLSWRDEPIEVSNDIMQVNPKGE